MKEFIPENQESEAIEAVVFDFDGTLATLEIDFGEMRSRLMSLIETFGRPASDFPGGYLLEIMGEMHSWLATTDAGRAEAFMTRAWSIVEGLELEAARKGRLFPATRPVLESLRNQGIKLGLITRNFGRAVKLVFPNLADYFAVFLPREAVRRVKPEPEHLVTALDRLGVVPQRTIMVGDHPIDIETGRRAGTMTAGVATGRVSRAELAAAGADTTFEHLGQLADWLLHRPPFGS